ncbi:MAG: hypothetical protein N2C13_02935 [Chloroflexota bacterium]
MHDGTVFGAVGVDDVFVSADDETGLVTRVPNECDHAAGFEDALEFRFGFGAVEPVKGLGGGDEIDGMVGQGGGLGGGVEAGEIWIAAQTFFCDQAHGLVGFDCQNRVTVIEEELCEQASAGADVCDSGMGGEVGIFCQVADNFRRIARAIFAVVNGAAGEACGGG